MYIGIEGKKDLQELFQDYNEDLTEEFKDISILFAVYSDECYEGTAFVLFHKDGKLFEVNGGHCSCYGLEGQWDPEETTLEALIHRTEKGRLGSFYGEGDYTKELLRLLKDIRRFGV